MEAPWASPSGVGKERLSSIYRTSVREERGGCMCRNGHREGSEVSVVPDWSNGIGDGIVTKAVVLCLHPRTIMATRLATKSSRTRFGFSWVKARFNFVSF